MKNNKPTNAKFIPSGIRNISLALIGGFALLSLSSCATMHGFGQDVENTGEEIQHATH